MSETSLSPFSVCDTCPGCVSAAHPSRLCIDGWRVRQLYLEINGRSYTCTVVYSLESACPLQLKRFMTGECDSQRCAGARYDSTEGLPVSLSPLNAIYQYLVLLYPPVHTCAWRSTTRAEADILAVLHLHILRSTAASQPASRINWRRPW